MVERELNALVSVIIPAYNAEKTIESTLNSVFKQGYANLEIIVVNDGSTDNTLGVLNQFQGKIKIISTPNQGVSEARTIGVKNANGFYIQYLDADDLLADNKLEIQVKALQANNASIAYGDWQKFKVENDKIVITENISKQLGSNISLEIFNDFWCPPACLLYTRTIVEKITWNKNLPIIQDARYLLDASLVNGKFIYTSGYMALYRAGQTHSLSQKSSLAFVKDCFTNAKEVFALWNKENRIAIVEKEAIINCLRYCINEFRSLNLELRNEAIHFLLKIEPKYIPQQKGMLQSLSKLLGYKNAEKVATIKQRFRK